MPITVFKNLFLVLQSYFKFSFPTPRIFKISLPHYNWPIRCLSKNSCVAKIRFKKNYHWPVYGGSVLLRHPLLSPVGGLDKNVSRILMTNDLFFSMCTNTLLTNTENPKKQKKTFIFNAGRFFVFHVS